MLDVHGTHQKSGLQLHAILRLQQLEHGSVLGLTATSTASDVNKNKATEVIRRLRIPHQCRHDSEGWRPFPNPTPQTTAPVDDVDELGDKAQGHHPELALNFIKDMLTTDLVQGKVGGIVVHVHDMKGGLGHGCGGGVEGMLH